MSALTAGQYIDSRFRLIHPLGEGDARKVWLADDVDLGEQIALAILPSDTSTDRITLLRRAPTTPPFDFHRGSGFTYITMAHTNDEDSGVKVAAVMEKLRAIAVEDPGGGMTQAPEAAKPPVRLTPPPRVQPIRPITPRLARPPEERAAPAGRPRAMVPGIIGVVVLITAGLIFFLSRDAPPPGQAAGDPAAAPPPVDAPAPQAGGTAPHDGAAESQVGAAALQTTDTMPLDDLRRRAYLKDQAEESARRARDLGESLQTRGVTLWGDDRFTVALQRIADGDARLAEEAFGVAESLYLEAIRTLQAVDARSLDVLQELLADGRSALAAGDATAAAAAFSLAARIDPSSRTAATGVRRAEVLDELNALLDDGARQEQSGDIAGAERTYNRAVALDPLSQAAREALARVKARLGDDLFSAAISAGLAALDRNDFQAAREAFRRAGALRPESRQAAEGLVQTEEAEKLATITAHRDRAIEMEEAERWRAAEKEYDAILRLDPVIRIAGEGAERTRARAELSEALAYHLDHPDRLAADEVFEEASRLHDRAAAIAPAGPQLHGQVEALDALLARMRDAVRVVLESDERTEVTIYRVGRLGTFSRHEVELRPGTYTIVGTRRGYRDVRHRLVITPGKEPDILVVRCEEKI
jgi:tetratricopeptide (TPR) repeat protein